MFLVITEDNEIMKCNELQEGDLQSCDDGYLDVIDISNPEEPKRYSCGGWSVVSDTKPYKEIE